MMEWYEEVKDVFVKLCTSNQKTILTDIERDLLIHITLMSEYLSIGGFIWVCLESGHKYME